MKTNYDNTRFYEAQENWINNHNKKDWDIMFIEIYNCCCSLIKTKTKNKQIPDLEGKALDTTIAIMEKYKNNPLFNISYLPAYCNLSILKYIYHKQIQFEEQTISYDSLLSDSGEERLFQTNNNEE